MEKITYKTALENIIATFGDDERMNAEVKSKITDLIASLDKRAKAPRAPSAEVKENAKLRNDILANMVPGKNYSINDLIAVVPSLATASSHKVSALLTPLKNDGKVVRVEIKRKAYFYKPLSENEAPVEDEA